jgi:hypothetical protein
MPLKNPAAKFFIQTTFSLALLFSTSTAEAENARTMTFPADQSYGTIVNLGPNWNILEKHPKGVFVADAKGTVPYSAGDALGLTANFPFTDNPAVINKLPVDAFQFINISMLPAEDKVFGPLSRLTGLRRLDFQEGEFHDKAFAQLSKLINLEAITVNECFVTGESLTHFGTLKKLEYLSFKKVALDWKLLNKSTTVFPALVNLHFTSTNLNDEGLKWCEKMPKLSRLVLDTDGQVTDKGLLTIKKLPQLRTLQLKQMKVTPKGIMQLKGSKLTYIGLEDAKFTPEEVKQLKDAMPNVRFVFGKRKMKDGTMEIFAPLH